MAPGVSWGFNHFGERLTWTPMMSLPSGTRERSESMTVSAIGGLVAAACASEILMSRHTRDAERGRYPCKRPLAVLHSRGVETSTLTATSPPAAAAIPQLHR